jgi:hypothetical protein
VIATKGINKIYNYQFHAKNQGGTHCFANGTAKGRNLVSQLEAAATDPYIVVEAASSREYESYGITVQLSLRSRKNFYSFI